MKKWIPAALALMLAATVAKAQARQDKAKDKAKKNSAELFDKLDTNKDGQLSKAEYTDFWTRQQDGKGNEFDEGKFDTKFDEMDGNGDLLLSKEEFSKGRKSKQK